MPRKDDDSGLNIFDMFSVDDKPKKKTRKRTKEENPFAEALGSFGGLFPGPEPPKQKRKRRATKSKESLRVNETTTKSIRHHPRTIEPMQSAKVFQTSVPSAASIGTHSSVSDSDFNVVLQQIRQWVPLKRYSTEEGYHPDLHNFLRDKCGHVTHLEEGPERADIVVDDRFPIELKKNPTKGEYDRMHGQLLRNECAYGCAIGVVCDVKRLEAFHKFVATVNKAKGNKKIEILSK